jgi:hypothetical protein
MALQISDLFIYLTTIFQQHRLEMPWIELELATLGSYDVKPQKTSCHTASEIVYVKVRIIIFFIL